MSGSLLKYYLFKNKKVSSLSLIKFVRSGEEMCVQSHG